jgi:hypothetical protein
MAKITANQRANAIAADQTKIQKEWAAASSTINRLTLELKEYAAWKNYNYVNGNSDFDKEDIDTLNAQFLAIFTELQANMVLLGEIGNIPNNDVGLYEANNNAYIAANPSIDVIEYDKRYQV